MSNQLRWLIQTFNSYFMMVVHVAEFYLLKMREKYIISDFLLLGLKNYLKIQ